MAVLKKYAVGGRTSGGEVKDVILTIDGSTVGSIEKTPGGNFIVKTKGLIPAIDGITGAAVDHVWLKIAERVRGREVFLTRLITEVEGIKRNM